MQQYMLQMGEYSARQQLKLANLRAALHVTAPSPRELYTSVVKREVDKGARGVVGAEP